ncbi:MAG: hypothetical protein KJO69_04845 [Gammaproteobacteria bacterium]|nr:hypothetical protein [Gammaproteobacteria bacterium]
MISQFSLDQDDWNECYTYFESQGYSHEECLDRANEREGFTTEESAAILRIFHVLGQGGFGLDWTPVRGKDSIVRRETLSWRERADLQDENYGEWVGEMTVFTQLFN